jgi:aminoglycoside 3-N-acetyltransferase
MGHIEGGADTVVDAFLDVLAPTGTLVIPTYTPSHRGPDSVFDPVNDPSEVGQITEIARKRPGAVRSCNLRESVAALGPAADEMMRIHSAAWSVDGPFWKLYEMDARILMLGVPYFRTSFWHMIEQMLLPEYGRWTEYVARIKDMDGTTRPLPFRAFGPGPDGPTRDFNKLGARLESRGLVSIGTIGNAMARLFRARDAFDVGVKEFRDDTMLFSMTDGSLTKLHDGVSVGEPINEKSVVDPDLMYAH